MKAINGTKNTNAQLRYALFVLAYMLFFASRLIVELGLNDAANKALQMAGLIAAFASFFLTLKRKSIVQLMLLITSIAIATYVLIILSGNMTLPYIIAFVLATRNQNQRSIISLDLFVKLSLVAIVLTCDVLGLSQERNFVRGGEIRYALGFSHPNTIGHILLNIFFDIIVLINKKPLMNLAISIPFFLIIIILTGSRGAAYGLIIFDIVQLMPLKRIAKTNRQRGMLAIIMIGINIILSLYLAKSEPTPFLQQLDNKMSGRIHLFRAFYSYYGVKLMGNKFEVYGDDSGSGQFYVLDNNYLYLLIHDGIILFTLMIAYYTYSIKKSLDNNNRFLFGILSAFAFSGVVGKVMISPIYNPFILGSNNATEKEN